MSYKFFHPFVLIRFRRGLLFALCSVGRHRPPLALAPKKSVTLQVVRQPSSGFAPGLGGSGARAATAPAGQALLATATVPPGGQADAGAREASTEDVEQPTAATTLSATTEQMEPPAMQVVASAAEWTGEQTEVGTSVTCSAGLAQSVVTPPRQMEVEVSVTDGSWPGVTATSQEETT